MQVAFHSSNAEVLGFCSIQRKDEPMEHILATRLHDFDHGRMTRRQLIQGLARTATPTCSEQLLVSLTFERARLRSRIRRRPVPHGAQGAVSYTHLTLP